MKILPINNAQNNTQHINTQFKAKFPKKDVKQFLTEIEEQDRCAIPQLYTLLDFIKKLFGENANIKQFGVLCQIHLDGKSLTNERKYINACHALYDSVVMNKNSLVKDNGIKRLSEKEFENIWYKNADKTKQDIENMFDV